MSVFAKLNGINVNEHVEKKGAGSRALSYLSWAWAWAEVKKAYPLSYYTIYENRDGCLYHTDGRTCWVKTGVTIVDGEWSQEHIEYLPVMDNTNRSIGLDRVTSFDVNKAIQRSLTKACARHGLGLYIYAGEDLPEGEADETPAPQLTRVTPAAIQKPEATAPVQVQKAATVYSPAAKIAAIKLRYGVDNAGFASMRKVLVDAGIVEDKPSEAMTEADWRQLFDAFYANFGDPAEDMK